MRRTPFRISVLLLAFLALFGAACSGGAGELGAPTLGGTLAFKVGDFEYTNADLEAEVEAWASNPLFLEAGTGITNVGAPGARSVDLTSFVVGWRINSELARQVSSATGMSPTADDLAAVRDGVNQSALDPTTGGPLLGAHSQEFQDRFIEDLTYQQLLSSVPADVAVVPAIEVNSRYGSYSDTAGLLPPQGPAVGSFSLGS